MNHYCTLFDSFYLTRGLALYRSLEKTGEPFKLYIFCFDDLSFELLKKLKLSHAVLIPLSEFEIPELLNVKAGRTRGEYCWTCTSHTIGHVLQKYDLEEVTYLDADLYFFQRPEILLKEFRDSGASVLITEHRYTPRYDQSQTSGIYCVQFMTFKNDERGLTALNWWQERCLEWCFARHEDGKFGDQKYLDDWTTRFKGVHVLKNIGGGLAPWNIQQYNITAGPHVDGMPVIFYHFHNLKWFASGQFNLADRYKLSESVVKYIYAPYLKALKASLDQIKLLNPSFESGKLPTPKGFKSWAKDIKRRLKGGHRFIDLRHFR